MPYRYILFDLDGTLTDSREGIFRSIRHALEKMGRPVPPEEVLLRFIGPPLRDSFIGYCGMAFEEAEEAVKLFRERYEVIGWRENRAAPGILPLLEKLAAAGYVMAVASSKPERSVIPICSLFGFEKHIIHLCGSDNNAERKSDVIRKALNRMGVTEQNHAQCVMVGDRHYDIHGAAEFGIDCIGVEFFPFAEPGELAEAGAIAVCPDAAALERVLLG